MVNHALRPRARKLDGVVNGRGVGYGEAAGSPQAAAAVGAAYGATGGGGGGEGWGRQGELEPRVSVLKVRVRGNKLAIEGEMSNGGPFLRVPFRYDFSLSASRDGHVLHFKGSSVYWGTPGGHVPLPMLPLQSFNIDLGDRCVFVRGESPAKGCAAWTAGGVSCVYYVLRGMPLKVGVIPRAERA